MIRKTTLLLVLVLAACGTPPAKSNNGKGNNANNATNNANNPTNSSNSGTDRDIWASDYDQTCAFDGECVVVHEGDACLCGGTACGNTGINATELDAWTADREALCAPEDQICSAAPCPELVPVCTEAGCDAREAVYIDPSGLDTSCEVDDDCMIVVGGEVCSSCRCGGTAVNAVAGEEYLATIPTVDCRPGPDVCDCPVLSQAWCNDGTCEPGVAP